MNSYIISYQIKSGSNKLLKQTHNFSAIEAEIKFPNQNHQDQMGPEQLTSKLMSKN